MQPPLLLFTIWYATAIWYFQFIINWDLDERCASSSWNSFSIKLLKQII